MLTLMFGTIEVSSGVAIDRKVTLTARSLSDLVSQGTQVTSSDLQNFFGLGSAIMTPYPVTPGTMTQKVSAVTINASKTAKVALELHRQRQRQHRHREQRDMPMTRSSRQFRPSF